MKDINSRVTIETTGLWGVLQVVLIILKLACVIDWSWKIVLIPLWVSLGGAGICFLVILLVYLTTKKIKG